MARATLVATLVRVELCALVLFSLLVPKSHACECTGAQRPCEYLRAETVFAGTVNQTASVRHFEDENGYTPGYSMRFAVSEWLRGGSGQEITVETGSGGGDCGTPFRAGERYLIFAYRGKDGKLWTGMCAGNQPLTGDPRFDKILDEYRALGRKSTATIFGRVEIVKPVWRDDEVDGSRPRPAADVVIHASSAGPKEERKTVYDGTYEFNDLVPGKYTLAPEIDKSLDFDHEYPERYVTEVAAGQCADINFVLEPNTRIRGRVSAQTGVPLDHIEVVAIPTHLHEVHDFSGKWDLIDENGAFDLWPLPAGNYYVGVNINKSPSAESPFPPTYYPGVTDQRKAEIVHVREGDVKQLELKLPEIAKQRTVRFTAIGLDGKPMRKIYIQLEDLAHPGDASSYVNVDLDENGRGTLTIYAGYSYHLHGSHWVSYGNDWCSKAVVIEAGKEPVEAKFVMYRKDVSCEIRETDSERH